MFDVLHPFTTDFMLRALIGGAMVAVICAVVGTWVVARGMAFLGEALAHGMLPGVALATVFGAPVLLGAAASAALMSVGVSTLQRRGRLSHDTSIGLLFVGMLALGVIIVSHSRSFATDATAILFGDVLAIQPADLVVIGVALVLTIGIAAWFHHPFTALALDPRIAQVGGMRPRLAQGLLTGLVTLAVVAAYQAVGSLLVVGLLLAPAVAAGRWTRRIPTTMALAAGFGVLAVAVGLLVSWHTGTAAGASIAVVAVLGAALSSIVRAIAPRRRAIAAAATAAALALTGCATTTGDDTAAEPTPSSSIGDGHGAIAGAEEVAEPPVHLLTLTTDGDATLLDLLDETTTEVEGTPAPTSTSSDGRYLFSIDDAGVTVLDSGMWSWHHVDHYHYYRGTPQLLGTVEGAGVAHVAHGETGSAIAFPDGTAVLLGGLGDGSVEPTLTVEGEPHDGLAVPFGGGMLVTEPDASGAAATVSAVDADGTTVAEGACPAASDAIATPAGTVVACADGALVATETDGTVVLDHVALPDGVAAVTDLDGRLHRPTVGGIGADGSVVLFDARERTWSSFASDAPLARVVAVDDSDEHVLALTADGRVRVFDASGAPLAETDVLLPDTVADADAFAGVTLVTDAQRAYLNAPLERQLFEIDFADGARIARTFDTETEPAFMTEVGR